MPSNEQRLLSRYAWIVGLGLLAQGALTVALLTVSGEAARRTHGILNHEARHGVLHVVLGTALLALVMREKRPRSLAPGILVFGVFYLALAVLGIATHNPFGLTLGSGENGFHLIVGGSALAVAGGSVLGATSSSRRVAQ
jgi:hypothetical protein